MLEDRQGILLPLTSYHSPLNVEYVKHAKLEHILFKILIILFEILIILFEIPHILFPPTLQSRSPRQLWFKGTHA